MNLPFFFNFSSYSNFGYIRVVLYIDIVSFLHGGIFPFFVNLCVYELPVPSAAFFPVGTLQLHPLSPGDGVELDFFLGLSKPICMARDHMHCTYLAFSP